MAYISKARKKDPVFILLSKYFLVIANGFKMGYFA